MKKITLHTDNETFALFSEDFSKYLQGKFLEYGYDMQTQSIHPSDESEFTIYVEMPTNEMPKEKEKSYLVVSEPPVIFHRNYKPSKYKHFKKLITWHEGLVNGENIIKINYAQKRGEVDFDISKKKKLCALVAKNKHSKRKNELFSERFKAVLWFEKNAPEDLDLYGACWDDGPMEKFLCFNIKKPTPKCYMGMLGNKDEKLKEYKFSIAYENWKNDAGYITEKIFDCFRASNVPVYLGASNIETYIPKNCFIDKRDFKSYDDLYRYLKTMDDTTYINYLKNIDNFLKGEKMESFSYESCANIIIKEILG